MLEDKFKYSMSCNINGMNGHTLKEYGDGSDIYYCTTCGSAEVELQEPCEK